MKTLKLILILIFVQTVVFAQNKNTNTVKNVIIMIPDGTSSSLLTLARWYNDNHPLAFDSLICGMIKTYCSDGKFPDSAPTSTAYATGVKSNGKNIGMKDSTPFISVLELAKMKGLATGIVATCQFPHATPADFVCHYYDRDNDAVLAKQFIYNSPDLVFSGGKKYIDGHNYNSLLDSNKIKLIIDKDSFKNTDDISGSRLWALFPDWQGNTKNMSYECDRDSANVPGLSEMTDKAIRLLNKKGGDGFFLMVEGSQIDWASHNNDPYAAVTDFLEFNKAVGVALKHAEEIGNTAVIICPDHGTGGICIGNKRSGVRFIADNPKKYDKLNIKDEIINPLKEIEKSGCSGRKLAEMMLKNPAYISKDSLVKYYNIHPTEDFLNSLKKASEEKNTDTLQYMIGNDFSQQYYIGWPTTGHTAEDVFLAIYTPQNVPKITGVVQNDSIGRYIAAILDLGSLPIATNKYYSKITLSEYKTEQKKDYLVIEHKVNNGKKKNDNKMVVYPNTNKIELIKGKTKETIILPTIVVRINDNCYLPEYIVAKFEQ